MPRLTDEQIKQGFSHADIHVRTAVLSYFSEIGGPPDPTVMPLVIETLARFGRDAAFEYYHPFSKLAQTPETVAWAAGELATVSDEPKTGWSFREALERLFAHADPELVRPHAAAVAASPAVSAGVKEDVRRRLDVWTWDEASLWAGLEAACRRAAGGVAGDPGRDATATADHFEMIEDIAEALARFAPTVVPRVTAALDDDVGTVAQGEKWRYFYEGAMVRVAGQLRHEPAVPVIFAKFLRDEEGLNEDCLFALTRIGTDAVADGVRERYSDDLEWGVRMYLAGPLGHIPSERAVAVLTELIPRATDDDELLDMFLYDLFGLFSPEGNAFGIKFLPAHGTGFEAPHALRRSCQLTGQSFPELDRWTARLDQEDRDRRRQRERYAEEAARAAERWKNEPPPRQHWTEVAEQAAVNYAPQAPIVKQATPGRNDPCPCGSGKKYKKCCQLKSG